jgi:hypothetical protein
VLFADYGELLACLALDWCAGTAATRWWWKTLFPALDVAEAVRKAWVESPQHVPAALCRLGHARRSEEFLGALSPTTAAHVLENVLSAFGLTELRPVLITRCSWPTVSDGPSAVAGTKSPAPWSRWIRVEPSLPPEHRKLLMVCAMLERAPGVLRSPGFARALCAWHETTGNGGEPLRRDSEVSVVEENVTPQTSRASDRKKNIPDIIQSSPARSVNRIPVAVSHTLNPAESSGSGPAIVKAAEGEADPLQAAIISQNPTPIFGDSMRFARSNVPGPTVPPTTVTPLLRSRDVLSESLTETLTTDWGGVFYLVNVALALKLYADFTAPLEVGLALPVWDFLALAGRRMIGPEFEMDPLWAGLAELSGRDENDSPGLWFEPPEEWRVPLAWLAPFAQQDEWRWSVALGRLRLIHPQNFLVLDVGRTGEPPVRQMENEVGRLGAFSVKTPILEETFCFAASTEPRKRWLDCLVPYIQARLERALGIEGSHPLHDLVFRHQATVEITSARVDARFQLTKHPIELRLAGLDRDPGWVPAAGRTIAFHYD